MTKFPLTAAQILGFTNQFLVTRFDNPQPTPDFHVDLWKHACSDDKYVAIAAPRGHAKSTAVTHSFTLACLCWRVKKHVVIVSDTEGQAISFLQDIKREFLENEDLIEVFGFSHLTKETEKEIIGRWTDGREFRLVAFGSNQKVRGQKWRNSRPDLVVGDDLENDELVMNQERRDKFKMWAFGALMPMGGDDCHYRFVGTILHLDSFLESLMPNEQDPKTVVEPLRIWSRDRKRAWLSVKYRAHPSINDFSETLWPSKFTRERLEMERQIYLDQGRPEGYAQEYLNNPIDESNAYFRKPDFLPIPEAEKLFNQREGGIPEIFYAAIDMAISEKETRAYTVIAVIGVTEDGTWRVRDIRRFRGDSLDIIEEMFAVQLAYQPELFIVEKENIASSVLPVLEESMGRANRPFINLEPMPPHGQDKIKRARSLQYRMRAHKVQFDVDAEWFPDLQQEMLYFPRGKYMDQVDALAWVALAINKLEEAPTWKEVDDMEWEREYFETSDMDEGRDMFTGY